MPAPACSSAASAAIWARRSTRVIVGGGVCVPSVMKAVGVPPSAGVSCAGSQARLSVSTL